MKKLRLWTFTFLLAQTLFIAIEGHADSDRPSINANGMVRTVYFLPSDRPARSDRVAALRQLIKDAQQFYADEMHRHGFGGKTFTVETDNNGEPLIHQFNGKFTDEHYYNSPTYEVWREIREYFDEDDLQHVYFVAIDLRRELLEGGTACGIAGLSFYPAAGSMGFDPTGRIYLRNRDITTGEEVHGGFAIIPASGACFGLGVTAHELGHTFGLAHDFRKGRHSDYIMAGGTHNRLSRCAAEWLSVSRFFNTQSIFRNEPGEIQLLSLRTYSQDVLGIRFKVADPDGLHQAQLLVPDILNATGWGPYRLFDCKRLNGKTGTVETVVRTAELVDRITLQIIDVGGNITWATFPLRLAEISPSQNTLDVNNDGVVNILDLTPFVSRFGQRGQDPADVNKNGVIDIVDVLLVAAHMHALFQQAGEMFTEADVQQWLTHAKQLEVENEILKKGIVELERLLAVLTAVTVDIPDPNLRAAIETALRVSPGTPIVSSEMETLTRLEAGNANISDLTGLKHATNLIALNLWDNSITDISALSSLTNLKVIGLGGNSVTDISVVSGLTNLTSLHLPGNKISDASAVSGLTRLTYLNLSGTNIADISSLSNLTNLTELYLAWNNITDISVLSGLTNLTKLWAQNNSILDLSPLVTNTGLGSGDTVNVKGNPLSAQSIQIHIPALQSRGITVEFDNRIPPPPINTNGMVQGDVPFANEPFDVNNIPEPVPPPKEVRDFFDLDPFYQQWINIKGFPVIASANVSPYAVKESAWEIGQIIGHRSDILKALALNRGRYAIIAHNEVRSDLPEFRDAPLRFYYDVRQRGGGGLPTIFGSEDHTFSRSRSDAATHEMAHGIHIVVNRQIDPTFDNRLEKVYNAAMDKGLWQGSSLAINRWEYWAEGVTTWFHANPNSPIQTRDALKAYDPDLAELIVEIFGDYDWRYTPIQMRTHLPHLQGFNLQEAPRIEWPPGVVEAYEELRNPAIEERNEWVNLPPYDPSMLPHLNELRNRNQADRYSVDRTDILVANIIDAEILFYWVNPDGTETLHYRFPPKPWMIARFPCRVDDLLLAKDSTGRSIAVFQAKEKTGRALVVPTLHLITPGLSKVSGDNQAGEAGSVLANPFVIEVWDENLSVRKGISVTFTVTAGDGTLGVTRTTTDENGRAESTLTLGQNPGTNVVSVSAAGIEGMVTFTAVVEAAIDIPDANLRAALETILGKAEGDSITPSEMITLTRLEAQNANISDLTGLEFAINLVHLYLPQNSVSEISAVAGLTNLIELALWDNSISDISAIAGLSNLTGLHLGGNLITDLSPVAGLTRLTLLHLPGNPLKDVSVVSGLSRLTYLNLAGTNITDLSPVSGLTHLTTLPLQYNRVSDLSPLAANAGLGSGDEILLNGNPLSYSAINTHIPILQSRGVTVDFDNQAHPALLKISGNNQKGAALTSLSQPFVVEAQDENGSLLVGIPVTFAITAGGGTLSITTTRTDRNGRAQSTLTLGPNLGTNTVQVSAPSIRGLATFHAIADTELPLMTGDVNNDGLVNVLDLILIASSLGQSGQNDADINWDRVVSILDLVLAAGMFDGAVAAPAAQPQVPDILTAIEVQSWLTDARALEVSDPIVKRGFIVLEQLLVSLTPRETELLANYPNPFNPETWIPYRLAEDAFVTLTIYDGSGRVVRTLEVGHRIASAYENRSKAIYWDGRNDVSERVASDVYFYTLTAGDFSATRRMLILK